MAKVYQHWDTAGQAGDPAVVAPEDEDWRWRLKRRWETGMGRSWHMLRERFGRQTVPAIECKHWAQIHAMEGRRPAPRSTRKRWEGWRKSALVWSPSSPASPHWAQIHAADGAARVAVPATWLPRLRRWWQRMADRLRTWRRQLGDL